MLYPQYQKPIKPKQNYIPKNETQQSQFLSKYPEFDGRGLKMAIIDSGIDVSLPGLQKTSTGLPKIIDCFEFTGKGSVDTSIIKKVDENNSLISLSGRELKIPLKWKNPSKEWHLGIKPLLKLCDIHHSDPDNETKLLNYLAEINSAKNEDVKPDNNQKLNDSEEIIDFIVWNDGKKWCSALITSDNCDDFENVKLITNFGDEQDFCFLIGKITCCVTIRNDGNSLQICTSLATHGTQVAHVAVSHYPDNSEFIDGLAPGAQIYFMEVMSGDFEEGAGEKALMKCVELGVNVINISLGFNRISRDANFIDKLTEMQDHHGTIIVCSAGNAGPLFWTTIVEEEIGDQFLFIGGLIVLKWNEKNRKFSTMALGSSKGPSYKNGSRRISFVTPAQVIVPTAQWISETPQFVSGTSYAAPNAAGSIACLLSALKATSTPY